MELRNSAITSCSFYFLLLSFATVLNHTIALRSCEFPAIFNFGDSNSDTGAMPSAFISPNPPYGETYFHMPAGRYSDGRLVIDFIAESFNLPYLSAYLNSMGTNFTHGTNFASGGATITRPYSIIPNGGVFAKLMPKEKYFPKALYIFDIGQNDIGDALLTHKSVKEVNASVPDVVNEFSASIENMYELGARNFWIHNTGPIGCLPYILENFPSEKDEAGCAITYNQIAQYLNLKLNESVLQLSINYPLATFIYVDIYSVKYSLFNSPQKYGFELPNIACCGYGGKYNYTNNVQCGDKIEVNGTEIVVDSCDRPSIRVVWDGIHYTEAANNFVFNQISTGAFSYPPIPLNMSCLIVHY